MLLLDIREAADFINFSYSIVRKWTYRQSVPPHGWPAPVKVGKSVRYRRADLENWAAGLPASPLHQSVSIQAPEINPPRPRRGPGRPRKKVQTE